MSANKGKHTHDWERAPEHDLSNLIRYRCKVDGCDFWGYRPYYRMTFADHAIAKKAKRLPEGVPRAPLKVIPYKNPGEPPMYGTGLESSLAEQERKRRAPIEGGSRVLPVEVE